MPTITIKTKYITNLRNFLGLSEKDNYTEEDLYEIEGKLGEILGQIEEIELSGKKIHFQITETHYRKSIVLVNNYCALLENSPCDKYVINKIIFEVTQSGEKKIIITRQSPYFFGRSPNDMDDEYYYQYNTDTLNDFSSATQLPSVHYLGSRKLRYHCSLTNIKERDGSTHKFEYGYNRVTASVKIKNQNGANQFEYTMEDGRRMEHMIENCQCNCQNLICDIYKVKEIPKDAEFELVINGGSTICILNGEIVFEKCKGFSEEELSAIENGIKCTIPVADGIPSANHAGDPPENPLKRTKERITPTVLIVESHGSCVGSYSVG